MTTIKIRIQDDYTDQDVTIRQTIIGPQIEHYLEAFAAALLVAGFDQKLVRERMNLE